MHHSWWSYNKTATPIRQEKYPKFKGIEALFWLHSIVNGQYNCDSTFLILFMYSENPALTTKLYWAWSLHDRHLCVFSILLPAKTCGCKSMIDRLKNLLGVYIATLYTYRMPLEPYNSTYMMSYHLLMVKRCPYVCFWWAFFEIFICVFLTEMHHTS